MNKPLLKKVAHQLVSQGKGILAADESLGTIEKRFKDIKLPSTLENRRAYRELLFTTPDIGKYISGVILYDETLRDSNSNGTPFPKLLKKAGILSGIKVDMKAHPMAGFPGETITEGLDGLRERLIEYKRLGASFAKWRAVITIGTNTPTPTNIMSNAEALARYAALCQENDIVPIVEPEVLMDGDHSIRRCQIVTEDTLKTVFRQLTHHKIYFPGMLLKPNMVIMGMEAKIQNKPTAIAEQTYTTFKKVLPANLPGVVFLSGGQSPEQACENLNEISKVNRKKWKMSYSFGRALQQEALQTWQGNKKNIQAAQQIFIERAQKCSLASLGKLDL